VSNREIKFRIWNKNPVKSSMLYDVENVYDCLKQQLVHDKAQPSRGHTLPYDHRNDGMVWLQYTGIKCKNNQEIYEGDILYRKSTGTTGEVKFRKGKFIISWKAQAGYVMLDSEIETAYDDEIIGNIYETPEKHNNN